MSHETEFQAAARKLEGSINSWIPLIPDWPSTQKAMHLGNRLARMYGVFVQDYGFVETGEARCIRCRKMLPWCKCELADTTQKEDKVSNNSFP